MASSSLPTLSRTPPPPSLTTATTTVKVMILIDIYTHRRNSSSILYNFREGVSHIAIAHARNRLRCANTSAKTCATNLTQTRMHEHATLSRTPPRVQHQSSCAQARARALISHSPQSAHMQPQAGTLTQKVQRYDVRTTRSQNTGNIYV